MALRPAWVLGGATTLTALVSPAAWAHPGHGAIAGFWAGAWHPLVGLDHLLAMVCVGVLSAQLGRRSLWFLPVIFLGGMILGGILGITQISLPYGEIAIALSVLCLGAAIVADRHIPWGPASAAAALFALFHGNAHGLEMPTISEPVLYILGFLFSTAALHLSGVAMGLLGTDSPQRRKILRGVGAGVLLAGVKFLLG